MKRKESANFKNYNLEVPEFKLSKKNSQATKLQNNHFDYKIGKIRKFKTSKMEVNSPKLKSRNKNIMLGDYKSGPINPNFLKTRLEPSIANQQPAQDQRTYLVNVENSNFEPKCATFTFTIFAKLAK